MSYSSSHAREEKPGIPGVWKVAGLATLVVLVLLFLGFYPTLHSPVMWLWINAPMLITFTGAVVLGIAAYMNGTTLWGWLLGGASVFALVIGMGLMVYGDELANAALARTIQPEKIENILEMTSVRYLPKQIAETVGRNKMASSSFQLGDFDPYEHTELGEIVWTTPHVPNGPWNQLTMRNDGINIVVDAQTQTLNTTFACGENMAWWKSTDWQFVVNHFLAERPDVYYQIEDDGEILTIAPYIKYDFAIHVVFPVMIPRWGGVQIMHADCSIEDLSPEQAMADPRFAGRRIVPEAYARRLAVSWGYKDGWVNATFTHRDQTELPDLKGNNQMPILIGTNAGPQWFHALEPFGANSQGTSALFYVDAASGKVRLLNYPDSSALTGPVVAANSIQNAFPEYNWAAGGGTNASVVLEPRPVVRNGELYWMYTITNEQFSEVTTTALLRAKDNSVYKCPTKAALKAFIQGQQTCEFLRGNDDQSTAPTAVPATSNTPVPIPSEFQNLSDADLRALMRQALDELERREAAGQ